MLDVDFEIIDFSYVYDSFYDNIVPQLTEQMAQRLFREALNTTLEIIIKVQVIK
jgi:hypothetical protein